MSVEISGVASGVAQMGKESSQAGAVDNRNSQPSSQPPTSPAERASDSVSLTESASKLQQLTSAVSSMPVADAQRVSDVQRAIGTGSFQIEPDNAADNLVSQERDLALLDISKA